MLLSQMKYKSMKEREDGKMFFKSLIENDNVAKSPTHEQFGNKTFQLFAIYCHVNILAL